VYDCATTAGGGCYNAIDDTALQAGAETSVQFSSDTQGFAIVSGNVQIANSTGTAAAQNEAQLSSSGTSLNSMADQNGNFEMFVPLQAIPFDYAKANFEIVDPFSPNILGPVVVDLSKLTTATTFQLPIMKGVCIDDDAGAPDFDDPDCDSFSLSSNQAGVQSLRAVRMMLRLYDPKRALWRDFKSRTAFSPLRPASDR
jgi:hypothetical protein